MKTSRIEETTLVLVGAGNVATRLGIALHRQGFSILQVYSRTLEAAASLAYQTGARPTTSLDELIPDADLYLVSLKDDVLPELIPRIAQGKTNALLVHTAGSIDMDVWKAYTANYGVLYPLQTFSKQREVEFAQIPFLIESNQPQSTQLLKQVAATLSHRVYEATSSQRRALHLAAVFACNFVNHFYDEAAELLRAQDLPFDLLLPLIDETARKVHQLTPREAQTGPAVRDDQEVIRRHLELLHNCPSEQALYRLMSRQIHLYQQR
ncbi:MAG: DUF2520 domain-containing protein [Prevotellaceae bacterium]|jgi:predicted short-subunit dehydrogenase-like oxidoreductase (DUF2520 family)|nr:DUF2520 domain-containing protein [Prevotellaceae bacterium]